MQYFKSTASESTRLGCFVVQNCAKIKLDFRIIKNMKGRKKLPNELKALRGTDQPCRMSDASTAQTTTAVTVLPNAP